MLSNLAEESAEAPSKWYIQIIDIMEDGREYSSDDIAELIGLKGARKRQLLNKLFILGRLTYTATTKNRRYTKE